MLAPMRLMTRSTKGKPLARGRSSSARLRRAWQGKPLLALAFALMGASFTGCATKETLGTSTLSVVGSGVVNDPANKSLRFDILRFGLERFCEEMRVRGAPLKLHDDQPVMGRFYADACQSQILDEGNRNALVVQFEGRGYAWTNLTGRIGFRARGLVEFAPDFQMEDDAMYVYFRATQVDASDFELLMVESSAVTQAAQATGVDAARVGRAVVDGQLKRGFTVIRYDKDGSTDFELGLVPKGQEPFRPYTVVSSSKETLTNGRTEVHSGQQDYIGHLLVPDDDQALTLTMRLDGAPGADVVLLPARNAKLMLERYTQSPGAVPLVAHASFSATLGPGAPFRAEVPLPRGEYFLVLDHSSVIGATAPPTEPADAPAKVDYLVQLGDAP